MNGFAVDPQDPKVMYVAMRDGLFKSSDGGETWRPLGKELKNLAAVAVNPRKSNQVYASTADGMIFLSEDRGHSWRPQSK